MKWFDMGCIGNDLEKEKKAINRRTLDRDLKYFKI